MKKTLILIIDDDPGLRKTLADILKVKGYETLASKDGAEGLSLLQKNAVDLTLIDLGLPDISGLDVLSRIKADHPSTAVIIVTGNATLESAIEATSLGAFSYLLKPYEIDQLMLQIKRAIEKQRADQNQEKLYTQLRMVSLMSTTSRVKERPPGSIFRRTRNRLTNLRNRMRKLSSAARVRPCW